MNYRSSIFRNLILNTEIVLQIVTEQSLKCVFADIVKIYCADHTYSTLRLPMSSSVHSLIEHAREKLGLGSEELVLCEIKSSGGINKLTIAERTS